MRVAIVAGPDAGHAFPAFALAERLTAVGDTVAVYTGSRWFDAAGRRGIDIRELPGLELEASEDAGDAGQRLGARAARMTIGLIPELRRFAPDLVVSDVITVCGGWAAAELAIPWMELSPHPLYRQSRHLPPIGSGLTPGAGPWGRGRDHVLRASSSRWERLGERQRRDARVAVGLRPHAAPPVERLIATVPALEVPRPDWPVEAHLVGPLLWEPVDTVFPRPPGHDPLVVVAPSTAETGAADLVGQSLAALAPEVLGHVVRVVISALHHDLDDLPDRVVAATGRQDELLTGADLVICGAGHGMLAKTLCAGVPVVTVPGGGDQWELANRAQRLGVGPLVRPVTVASLADAVRTVLSEPGYRERARAAAANRDGVEDPVRICHLVG
ncbi:glycosyltransferase [Williamsia sterculiae]|uniref:UDP:flavonoid glycosyltransferase YjiC, YdhE family n=1 Tax=Williamsia sterculiae TaxID=1344003 RepID=A0A1N7EDG1_9NOCA|nr:glycosyltransferase [Williamsia sterculiae]SIR86203.1 UDP:flavonoid glycosyltransferase YjiC, YdhE family [Williamsia sterculiae]